METEDNEKNLNSEKIITDFLNTDIDSNTNVDRFIIGFDADFLELDIRTLKEYAGKINEFLLKKIKPILSDDDIVINGIVDSMLSFTEYLQNGDKGSEFKSIGGPTNTCYFLPVLKAIIDSNPMPSIVENDFLSYIQQFVTSNIRDINIDKRDLEQIQELIAKYQPQEDPPDLSAYTELLSGREYDADQFQEYMRDLEKYKCCTGIIPEEHCDFLIKQKLMQHSPLSVYLDQYFQMFKRALEDKTRHILMNNGIQDPIVSFTSEEQDSVLGESQRYKDYFLLQRFRE